GLALDLGPVDDRDLLARPPRAALPARDADVGAHAPGGGAAHARGGGARPPRPALAPRHPEVRARLARGRAPHAANEEFRNPHRRGGDEAVGGVLVPERAA